MFGKSCYNEINELLNQSFKRKKALIAMHRGAWGGNIVENTTASYILAHEMGADMFECDVSKSTDGILYAFHDGNEKRMLGIADNIESLSSAQIDELIYNNSIGKPSGVHVERFESIVSNFRNGELYNVDRAWGKLPETIAVMKQYPWAIKQALIKTPVRKDVLQLLNECPEKYMYMPIVYSLSEVEQVLTYPDINTVGVELIITDTDDELFRDDSIQYIHSKQLFTWANAIKLSILPEHVIFGGLDDDAALLNSKDETWGRMLHKGINVIQTDWPFQLKEYRDNYFINK